MKTLLSFDQIMGDSWFREYNEAVRLSEDITNMISEQRCLLPASGREEAQRYAADTRRKISILRTRLDTLHSLLSGLPSL